MCCQWVSRIIVSKCPIGPEKAGKDVATPEQTDERLRIGQRLKALYLGRGLKREEVALAVERSAYAVTQLEQGRTTLTWKDLIGLARVMGLAAHEVAAVLLDPEMAIAPNVEMQKRPGSSDGTTGSVERDGPSYNAKISECYIETKSGQRRPAMPALALA